MSVHLVRDGGEQNKEEFKTINPMGQVPAFILNDVTITQVLSMSFYPDFIQILSRFYPDFSEAQINSRDVTTGATSATAVAPKVPDTLTLLQPRGADSAHHRRGHR